MSSIFDQEVPSKEVTKNIYKLEPHQVAVLSRGVDHSHMAMRVPGGWIYLLGGDRGVVSTFVPYSDEFKPKGRL